MDDKIVSIVSQVLEVPVADIGLDSSPDTLPAWDSLKHLNLVVALEEAFRIQFSDRQVMEMMSVRAICAAVAQAALR